ncbi:hypothetical protein B0H14DRAFT_2588136 [Mycena olivaceomarginata]|nr:hypothetical protein B0H14DRAFT_2588136 [Mycena olivaceomarginata]
MFRPGEEPTLRTDVLEGNFDFSPGHCQICSKPNFKNSTRPDHSFTIIPYCWHHPDNARDAVSRNKSISGLLPSDHRHHTPAGNLMVIKHQGTDGYIQDLPVVNVVPDDHTLIVDLSTSTILHGDVAIFPKNAQFPPQRSSTKNGLHRCVPMDGDGSGRDTPATKDAAGAECPWSQ